MAACGSNDKSPDAPPDPNLVVTTAGSVRGSSTASMRSFLGIPYAAPPVGTRRWKAPTAPAPFSSTRDATQFAKHCPQPASPFGMATNIDEDWLYLNVYTPTSAGPHPVMFWIHGGAFFVGESDEYDAAPLVAEGMVVVTINYRLGALGFMAHPALTTEGNGASGNYGLMDQQLALHWVQDNIAAFGGDRNNVTIIGESAGGFSVESQLVISGGAGLFHKAIVESGAYANNPALQPTLAASEATGVAILTQAGCADPCSLEAMRGLSADALVAAQAQVPAVMRNWIPSVDTKLMTTSVGAAFAAGTNQKVPVIEGSNHDEYRLFAAINEVTNVPPGPLTPDSYVDNMKRVFGDVIGAALAAAYPVSNYGGNAGLAQATAGTDVVFACPMRTAAAALSAHGTAYAYEFDDPQAPMLFLPPVPDFDYGAAHASEIQYIFTLPNSTLTPEQKSLAANMVQYWTNFAKTGDPNGMGLTTWAKYDPTADGILSLAPGSGGVSMSTGFKADHKCQ